MKIVNRKAYHEYTILESFDSGIVLLGNEVKSIRMGNVVISDSFAYINNGEIFIKNIKVSKYRQSNQFEKFDPNRDKKLLLNRREINKIEKLTQDKGTTIVALEVFLSNNKIKIKIAVVKGKKLWNKKEDIKKRDIAMDTKREIDSRRR